MNKLNENNEAKYISLLCTQPYENHHLKIGFNVPNVCSCVAIDVRITLAENFLCAIFVVFNFFDITMSVQKKNLLNFFSCHKAEVLKLILEIRDKDKKLFLILPGAKQTPYNRYAPSTGENGHGSKTYSKIKFLCCCHGFELYS